MDRNQILDNEIWGINDQLRRLRLHQDQNFRVKELKYVPTSYDDEPALPMNHDFGLNVYYVTLREILQGIKEGRASRKDLPKKIPVYLEKALSLG